MREHYRNPFSIAIAISAVGPKEDRVRKLTDVGGQFWKKKPYSHELALTKAFFGYIERSEVLDHNYASNLMTILEWILTLDYEDFSGKLKRPDRIKPLLLEDGEKKVIAYVIGNLKKADFSVHVQTVYPLKIFLTSFVEVLKESGLSTPLNFAG